MSTDLRPAAVAGTFYPAHPTRLQDEVDALMRAASVAPCDEGRPPKALIVPHAGYVYSGPIAARAYVRLVPFADHITRVVIAGPAHRLHFQGVALPEASAFETPLGVVPVDAEAAAQIPGVPRLAAAHAREHALEVQLPFLIRVLPRFTVVPLVVGDAGGSLVAAVLEALWGGPETLIVVSSDLSHYLPYEEARRADGETADRITALTDQPIRHDQACGATPVNGLLACARRRGMSVERIDVRSSGDTAGSREEVVGYGAFAFYEEGSHGD